MSTKKWSQLTSERLSSATTLITQYRFEVSSSHVLADSCPRLHICKRFCCVFISCSGDSLRLRHCIYIDRLPTHFGLHLIQSSRSLHTMKRAKKMLASLMQSAKASLRKKSRKSSKSSKSSTPPKSRQCTQLALPAELLSIVFTHVDPFTVWIVRLCETIHLRPRRSSSASDMSLTSNQNLRCRNVSKLWRAEAEAHFKLVWLPQLYFKVRCHLVDACVLQGQNRELSGWCKTTGLLHFSQVSNRVFFSVRQKYRIHLTPLSYWNSHRDYSDVMMVPTMVLDARCRYLIQTQYKVINRIRNGGPFNGSRPMRPIFLRQRPIPNQIELPGLKVYFNSNKISFLWKEFFTQFFLAEIRNPDEEENCGMVLCRKEGCRVTMNKNSKHWDVRRRICLNKSPKIHAIKFGDIERIFGRSISKST
ncbi:hypothetical protein DE146DRAFT_784645 [Phaeosphaeria sp. MPI-PUGE-AT-0046c]|nr:hypothetical protein DE146DRAFT_784645 [Phaeosphaeria sp. MPI-PUGE-AT-0046c]